MRTDILERKEDILKWIHDNQTKSFIAKQLKCKPQTLNIYLEKLGIEYKGNQGCKGLRKGRYASYLCLEEYLEFSTDIQSFKVKKRLLEEKIKEHKCERCGLVEWLGKPIPLELHHKDGNKNHNEISNYELLCPNCHALTDTYRGKNIKA